VKLRKSEAKSTTKIGGEITFREFEAESNSSNLIVFAPHTAVILLTLNKIKRYEKFILLYL
jgi:hypothetical protein